MNIYQELNPQAKVRRKFYNKIRSHLEDLELLSETGKQLNHESLSDVPEDDIYGHVTGDEFALILNLYEKQQLTTTLKDKPVKCDQLAGDCYAKLLFSKPGFHHPGSTQYLISDLRIKDADRNSFLGGHSTYAVNREDSLKEMRLTQLRMYIKGVSEEISQLLDKQDFSQAKRKLDQIVDLDSDNGDVLATQGRYAYFTNDYDFSISRLRAALLKGCSHLNEVSKHLSESLFSKGFEFFRRQDYQKAVDYFTESLDCDNRNENARLHFDLCQEKIHEQRRPFGTTDRFHKYRK